MQEQLIKVDYGNERPTIMGRDLHEVLEVETGYNDWFKRMCEYGFTEGIDFYSILSKTHEGGRPSTDHQLTIDMAKEICMIQRSISIHTLHVEGDNKKLQSNYRVNRRICQDE